MVALLATGVVVIALGGFVSLVPRSMVAGLTFQACGSAILGVTGFWILLTSSHLGDGFESAGGRRGLSLFPAFGVDPLSALFLGTLGLVATPALVFSLGYLRRDRRGRWVAGLMAPFLLTLVLVTCARDAVTFLTGWESMTLLPACVILLTRGGDRQGRRTVFTYLAITHLGGVGTWISVLLLARPGFGLGSQTLSRGSTLQVLVALSALFGMGSKAGLMPLHVWLPRAHPMAPAPVSALMSGVMIKMAVYGLVRVLVDWVGVLPIWFGFLVLASGILSAVGGVAYALFQHELKRLLALHSIENIGIIVIGLGACLVLRAQGAQVWAAVALAAALLHTVNHAVFKGLLFLGAGAFERTTGSLHLDRLGGLLHRMPWSAVAFGVGAMAIAGLPPLNGFVSEWLTFQSLMRLSGSGDVQVVLAGALGLAALAVTAGLAVTCFVKVIGLVLLGPSRTDGRATDGTPIREAPVAMVAAMVFLAGACVVLGLAPTLLFGPLTRLAPWSSPEGPLAAAGFPTGGTHSVLGLGEIPGTLRLPAGGALPTLAIFVFLVVLSAVLRSARGRTSAAVAPTWACGQLVDARLNWTSAGFTKPLRLVMQGALRPRRQVDVDREGGLVQLVTYRGHVPHLIDERVYRPVAERTAVLAAHARKLQSGSLGTYVTYLIALVVVLLAGARAGVIR